MHNSEWLYCLLLIMFNDSQLHQLRHMMHEWDQLYRLKFLTYDVCVVKRCQLCYDAIIFFTLFWLQYTPKYWGTFTKVEGETGYERTDCEFNTSSIKISKIKQDFIFWIKLWKNIVIIGIYNKNISLKWRSAHALDL